MSKPEVFLYRIKSAGSEEVEIVYCNDLLRNRDLSDIAGLAKFVESLNRECRSGEYCLQACCSTSWPAVSEIIMNMNDRKILDWIESHPEFSRNDDAICISSATTEKLLNVLSSIPGIDMSSIIVLKPMEPSMAYGFRKDPFYYFGTSSQETSLLLRRLSFEGGDDNKLYIAYNMY